MTTIAQAWHAYDRRRYTLLFYSLVLTMLLGPLLVTVGLTQRHLEIFLGLNVLAAIVPAGRTPAGRLLLVGLLALSALLRTGPGWLGDGTLATVGLVVPAAMALVAAASALGVALRAAEIDLEHVYAALGAYLLAGLVFGVLYWALEQTSPGSLTFTGHLTRYDAIYFSFITLATVGYGDISPHGDVARGLATIEGIGGQLFLAVLVARLVSLYRPDRAGR